MPENLAFERETLRSFLAGLDAGGHAAVCLESLSAEEAIQLCEEAGSDLRERVMVANRDIDYPTLSRQDLLTLATTARSSGARGLVLVVHGDEALEDGHEAHVASERALGPTLPPGVRIFCFYTRRSQHRWHDVLPPHSEQLDSRAWQVV